MIAFSLLFGLFINICSGMMILEIINYTQYIIINDFKLQIVLMFKCLFIFQAA